MDFEASSYLFAGFALYCLGLILGSSLIKEIKVGNFLAFKAYRNINPIVRRIFEWLFIAIGFGLCCYAIALVIDEGRNVFWLLAALGFLMVVVRTITILLGSISAFVLSLEVDEDKAKSTRFYQSPVIRGGLVFIFVFGLLPVIVDNLLTAKYAPVYQDELFGELTSFAKKNNFEQNYRDRSINGEKEEVFRTKLSHGFISEKTKSPGKFNILEGRAGTGKTWFITQQLIKLKQSGENIFLFNLTNINYNASPWVEINQLMFNRWSWYTMPLTRAVLDRSTVIIDGMDEIVFNPEDTDDLRTHLANFQSKFPHTNVIITTRPGKIRDIPNYEIIKLEGYTTVQYDNDFRCRRIAKMAKKYAGYESSQAVDKHFYDLLTASSEIIECEEENIEVVKTLFSGFLKRYEFNSISGHYYTFLSSFRDMDIVDDIFLNALFPSRPEGYMLEGAGKTALYEQLLIQRIIRNAHLDREKLTPLEQRRVAEKVLDQLTQRLPMKYFDTPPYRVSIFDKDLDTDISFSYDNGEEELAIKVDNSLPILKKKALKDFVLQAELMQVEERGDKKYLVFDHSLLDYYFISRILRDPSNLPNKSLKEIISHRNFYEGTTIIPFLIGQYATANAVIETYLDAVMAQGMSEDSLLEHFKTYFPEILLCLNRSESNIRFLRTMSDRDVFKRLPKNVRTFVQGEINTYLPKTT